MSKTNLPVVILMAEDNQDYCLLAKEAIEESKIDNDMRFVEDGEELLKYLRRNGKFTDPDKSPYPGLIVLDLNMPRKDGREALQEIKTDPVLKRIPVLVLTTSNAEEDMLSCYDLGANSYITKPATFERLVDLMKSLGDYWFEFVELPKNE